MKNQLSNMLLAGVIASTFLMVNCQKAPSKAVKADQANQKGAGTDVAVIVACSEEASAALNKRASDLATLKTAYMPAEAILFKDGVPVKDAKIDAATEQSLKNGKEALVTSQQAVDTAIEALKDAKGNKATGCTLTTAAAEGKPEKKEDLALESLQVETKALLSRVDVALNNVAGKASDDATVATDDKGDESTGGAPATGDESSISDAAKKAQAEAEAKAKADADAKATPVADAATGSGDLSSSDLSSSDLSSGDLSSSDSSSSDATPLE